MEGNTGEESNGVSNGFSNSVFSVEGDLLSLVGHDLDTVPSELGRQYGNQVKKLDLSYNSLVKLENLDKFTQLTSLVVDNNRLDSYQKIPSMDRLQILSVNNNSITDLKGFIDSISDKLPQLTFLSMLKNPACPNGLIAGKDSDDYRLYRLYVLYRIKNLRFLDSTPVTDEEKKDAALRGHLCLPVRPSPDQIRKQVIASSPPEEDFATLPPDLKQEGVGKASFTVSNYVYFGRQSEGNRFIVNDQL